MDTLLLTGKVEFHLLSSHLSDKFTKTSTIQAKNASHSRSPVSSVNFDKAS